MSVSFRQLEVFCAVAEHLSFTRASQILFISQSTVSQHIHELEEQLKVRLFDRNRRKVELSPSGRKLLAHGQRIFQMLREAESAARSQADPFSGRVSFGCASTTLLYQLPPILAAYATKFPNVELNIVAGSIQEVAAQLADHVLDLALVVLPLNAPGMQQRLLQEERFVAVLPAGHRLSKARRLRAADLAGERFILYHAGQNTRRLIEQFFMRSKVRIRVAFELADTEVIKEMVAHGLGVSVLPESTCPTARLQSGLVTLPVGGADLRRKLALVYSSTRPLEPAASAFADYIQRHFASGK
jgi:DNA-binding transcriptional LysR family regulator